MAKAGSDKGLAHLYHHRIAVESAKIVGDAFCVSLRDIMSKRRAKSSIVFARQLSMYLAHVVGQLSLNQVSAEFGRDRTTVGYSCNIIEDRRDAPIFDEQVEALEKKLCDRLTVLLTQDLEGGDPELRAKFQFRIAG